MEVHRPMHDDERDPPDAPAEPQPDPPAEDPAQEPAQPDDAPRPTPGDAEAWPTPPPPDPSGGGIPAHLVPATPLGEGTRCPRCGTDNRPGIAFCRSCGQRLIAAGDPVAVERPAPPEGTAACPRCGTHNRAGTAFCQNCGTNLRPPEGWPAADLEETKHRPPRAILGPVVLLIGTAGMLTAWLLPFAFGGASLWDRSFGAPGGYGIGFWSGYPAGGLVDGAYFGLAAPLPVLMVLLVVLAAVGFLRPGPGSLQRIGLLVALAWGLALAAMFVVVEVWGGSGGDLVAILRALSPAGIIFLLAGLIVAIGCATRLWRA